MKNIAKLMLIVSSLTFSCGKSESSTHGSERFEQENEGDTSESDSKDNEGGQKEKHSSEDDTLNPRLGKLVSLSKKFVDNQKQVPDSGNNIENCGLLLQQLEHDAYRRYHLEEPDIDDIKYAAETELKDRQKLTFEGHEYYVAVKEWVIYDYSIIYRKNKHADQVQLQKCIVPSSYKIKTSFAGISFPRSWQSRQNVNPFQENYWKGGIALTQSYVSLLNLSWVPKIEEIEENTLREIKKELGIEFYKTMEIPDQLSIGVNDIIGFQFSDRGDFADMDYIYLKMEEAPTLISEERMAEIDVFESVRPVDANTKKHLTLAFTPNSSDSDCGRFVIKNIIKKIKNTMLGKRKLYVKLFVTNSESSFDKGFSSAIVLRIDESSGDVELLTSSFLEQNNRGTLSI